MAFYTSGDSVNAIVADLGCYASKIGYAGEDYPRSYFRSVRMAVTRQERKLNFGGCCVFISLHLSRCIILNICRARILF